MRYWHSDKKIITLDKNNISDYIDLPGYIIDKYEKGIIPHPQFSDLIRAELLIRHGGIWIDATVYCTGRKFEDIMRLPFFVFQDKGFWHVESNWFIVSNPNNPILTMTRDILLDYWKNNDILADYLIFYMFFKMVTEAYPDEWKKVPYASNNPPREMMFSMYEDYSEERMEYFAGISDFSQAELQI